MLNGSPRNATILAAAGLAAASLLGLAGCGSGASGVPGKVDVVTAFYPLQFVAERVGGDAVSVSTLAKPGAEPHDLELSPRQVAQVADADLVLYLGDFQPAVDAAVDQQARDAAFDVAGVEPLNPAPTDDTGAAAIEESARDPHVWLDPIRLAAIADAVAARLGRIDPGHAGEHTDRAAALRADLVRLDAEYAAGLKTCRRDEIVVSHAAFGYLAARYHLKQVAISGLSPEEEPSPQRLAAVTARARDRHATTIFFETLVSPKIAEVIATETGATARVLDPIEGLQPGATGDYFSVMRANLAALRTALGCS